MNGKDIIMAYCRGMTRFSSDHIENCESNLRNLETNKVDMMEGCPTSFGIKDFKGDCEFGSLLLRGNEVIEQCRKCWTRALEKEYE